MRQRRVMQQKSKENHSFNSTRPQRDFSLGFFCVSNIYLVSYSRTKEKKYFFSLLSQSLYSSTDKMPETISFLLVRDVSKCSWYRLLISFSCFLHRFLSSGLVWDEFILLYSLFSKRVFFAYHA